MGAVRLKLSGVAGCAFLLALGGALLWLGVVTASDEAALERDGVAAEADVHDWRLFTRPGETGYELRYHFAVPGDPVRYTPGDRLGRRDLWIKVVPEAWEESRQSGRLAVRYLPADPRVNRPVVGAGNPRREAIVGIVLGVVMFALGLGGAVLGALRYWTCRANPTPDGYDSLLFYVYPTFPADRAPPGSPGPDPPDKK